MELVTTYNYLTSSIPSEHIDQATFMRLKMSGWYRDSRGSQNFQILNKRFNIEDQWYRVMVRFERSQEDGTYILNTPIPFIVALTETSDGKVFVDKQIFHGRKVKHALGYVEQGIPVALIDAVIQELKINVLYKNEK